MPTASAIAVPTPFGATPATLTAATAAVSSTSEATGTGASVRVRLVRGIARRTSSVRPSDTSTSTRNAGRQTPSWPNNPPTAGPRMLPTPHIADTSAAPRAHSRSGSARWISA